MPSREEFQQIALSRYQEARVLFENNHYDGAVYLAGYALESALKARICKILDADYPKSHTSFLTHKPETLLDLSGLRKQFDVARNNDTRLASNWALLTGNDGWNEQLRYKPIGTRSHDSALDILDALDDDVHGIITWLKTTW